MAKAIEQLPEKEKLVLSLYYFDELNMKETGKVLNVTESRVSQIHSQAVIHLRNKLRRERVIEN
jgi:RNA polymerase sigma factor for flagellar operon FliA